MCVCLISQSWLVLCDPMDCSPLGSSDRWTLLARILEWGAIFYSSKTLCIYQKMFSSVQSLSHVQLFATPWTVAHQASLSITTPVTSRNLLKPMFIKSMMPSDNLILSSPSPPAFNLFQHQGLFKWVSSSHQVTKVLEFQLQHQWFQWIFRTDFLNVKMLTLSKWCFSVSGERWNSILKEPDSKINEEIWILSCQLWIKLYLFL